MSPSPEVLMLNYAKAYENLYNRRPTDLRILDHEWVVVNGARIRYTDLQTMIEQLQQEYQQQQTRKNIVNRLIRWFKG